MIRFLQNSENINVDATKKASVICKRGAFVSIDEATGTFAPAVDLASVAGVVVRDTIVDSNVAQGMAVSEYSDTQDTINVGDLAGVRVQFKGERFSTDQFDSTLTDAQKKAGAYLTVKNGILSASTTPTSIMSLGVLNDAGHTVLGYKLV